MPRPERQPEAVRVQSPTRFLGLGTPRPDRAAVGAVTYHSTYAMLSSLELDPLSPHRMVRGVARVQALGVSVRELWSLSNLRTVYHRFFCRS